MRQGSDAGSRRFCGRLRSLLFGSVLVASIVALVFPAQASRTGSKPQERHATMQPRARAASDRAALRQSHALVPKGVAEHRRALRNGAGSKLTKSSKARYYSSRGLQCVPFARAASGIELKGNAANWWDAAAGVYQRGNRPEVGAVLNFRANGSMRLGHVAVVRQIVDSREIEIDHANWAWAGKGNVSRGVPVIDVSERNDWTAVRVGLGRSGNFGSVYGTYGFIYDRPDNGQMSASVPPQPNASRHDLRGVDLRGVEEATESPWRAAVSVNDGPARAFR